MIVVLVFILGLFVGSFLNVVIYRLHRQESFVKGFSKCLFCGHRLFVKDLVPLFSYLFLKRRCRYCRRHISGQYPLVELATGLVFVLVLLRVLPDFNLATCLSLTQLIGWWIIACFLIVIFVYDLKYYLILDKVVLPVVIFAFVINLILGHGFFNLVIGGLVGGLFFLIQFVLSKGRWIGGGDIRLGLLMGVLLGWPQVLIALFAAYILGSIISVGLLLASKKKWGDKVPFGTFLTIATFITLLYGQQLINLYWSLFY